MNDRMTQFASLIKYGIVSLFLSLFLLAGCKKSTPERLFIFSVPNENTQAAVKDAQQALLSIAEKHGWAVDTISDAKRITEEYLQHCAAVIFLYSSGASLNSFQLADLQRYIQAGGGFVGIHTEGETTNNWPWAGEGTSAQLYYPDLSSPEASFSDPAFLQSFEKGLQGVMGKNIRDYSKATTPRSPDEDRFVKVPLVDSVWVEPIEMSILPNLDILVIQRRGELMHYDHESKELTEAGKLDVFFQADDPKIHSEQGLVGLTLDPDFNANNFIYLFYKGAVYFYNISIKF